MDLFTQRCKVCNNIHAVRSSCNVCAKARLASRPILTERNAKSMTAVYDNGESLTEARVRFSLLKEKNKFSTVVNNIRLPNIVKEHVPDILNNYKINIVTYGIKDYFVKPNEYLFIDGRIVHILLHNEPMNVHVFKEEVQKEQYYTRELVYSSFIIASLTHHVLIVGSEGLKITIERFRL